MTHRPRDTAHAWKIATVPYNSPPARELTEALHREQLAMYGAADDPTATPADEFEPPVGRFLVAVAGGGDALACGGWRTLGPSTGEVKRMYVAPTARGQGMGRRILDALERDAQGHGKTNMVLETGVGNLAALGLYTACGYTRIDPYVADRNFAVNRAFRKAIHPASVASLQGQIHSVVPLPTGYPSRSNAVDEGAASGGGRTAATY